MDVSTAEAKSQLSELPPPVEEGEPVAQLIPPTPERRVVKFGTMRGKIHLKPGWDDPIDLDRFLAGEV